MCKVQSLICYFYTWFSNGYGILWISSKYDYKLLNLIVMFLKYLNRNKCVIGQKPPRGITNNQTTKGIDTDLKPTSARNCAGWKDHPFMGSGASPNGVYSNQPALMCIIILLQLIKGWWWWRELVWY